MGELAGWDGATVVQAEGAVEERLLVWAHASLRGGGEIARQASDRIRARDGVLYVIAPSDADLALDDPSWSVGLGQDDADTVALSFVRGLPGAATVFVEDEITRRTDPGLARELQDEERWASVGFVGEQVVRWSVCDERALELMRFGSHGYPRNAFLLSQSTATLGIPDGATLDVQAICLIVTSIMAIVVGVYDDETHLIWHSTPEPARTV